MVYESDFYTTRRPYRPSSYSVTRQSQVDWDKVPFVPRPSLVPDPITAFGKRQPVTRKTVKPFILDPIERAKIKPSQRVLLEEVKPYISARDATREKVLLAVRQNESIAQSGLDSALVTRKDHMDVVLPRLHGTTHQLPLRRHVFYSNYASY